MTAIAVRAPSQADVPAMARVVVTSWRETYRGLMRDDVLDDPGMLAWRERFWTAALTEPRYAANRVAVAEAATPGSDREGVGVAMSGPPLDDAPPAPLQLYVLAEHHGSGAGAGLLDTVVRRASRPTCGSPTPTPGRRPSTASTGSSPTA